MKKDNEPSPELFAAVKEILEEITGFDFKLVFSFYLEKNHDQHDLTEKDLVAEILEAGGYQNEKDSTFEDSAMVGCIAMVEDLIVREFDLRILEDLIAYLKRSLSTADWNKRIKDIKKANNGDYPNFWYLEIIKSGVMADILDIVKIND